MAPDITLLLHKIKSDSAKLNKLSDDAVNALRQVEQFLGECSTGYSITVPFKSEEETLNLAYLRMQAGSFKLVISQGDGPDDQTKAWTEWDRTTKLAAMRTLMSSTPPQSTFSARATSRMELPGDQLPASAAHLSAEERKERVQPRYRQAKATKCGGMGGRKSQYFDSTDEAGELAPEAPVEGSEVSADRPDRGKQVEHFEVPFACSRNSIG